MLLPFQDSLKRRYRFNRIKVLWKQGAFSNPVLQQLPEKSFHQFDADTWGEILEWELDRM